MVLGATLVLFSCGPPCYSSVSQASLMMVPTSSPNLCLSGSLISVVQGTPSLLLGTSGNSVTTRNGNNSLEMLCVRENYE